MNTSTLEALQNWLQGRNYTLDRDGAKMVLEFQGQVRAVITPPDRYQVSNLDLSFNEWVEFNKCIRNIRHYLENN